MNDNEKVEEIVKEMRRDAVAADAWCETHGEMASAASVLNRHSDRIFAAYRRAIAAKDDERLTVVATYETVIAGKDVEIEKLKFDNMRLKSEQRAAGEVIIEQTNKVEAKDDEIEKLRSLVGELADALDHRIDCECDCTNCTMPKCTNKRCRELVAEAREVVK